MTRTTTWWSLQGSAVLAGICLCVALSGCHLSSYVHHHPRSIDELYDEAVAARAKYPEHSRLHDQDSIPTERPGDMLPPPPGIGETEVSRTADGFAPAPGRAVRRDRHVTPAGATQFSSPAGPRVSEIFEETEIRQAIQVLATQAGASVVVDERVAGSTSAHIENEPFDVALKKILLPLGFVYKQRGSQFLIGITDPQSAMFSQIAETFEFRPMHLSPQELAQLLPESQKKYVQVIEKRNLMIIEAPEELAQRIAARLEQSDRPVPQVILEAMVCVINPTKSFQFNLDAKQSLTVNGKDLLNVGLTGLAFTGQATPAGLKGAFSDFALTSTFLRLLAQEGYVTIRAAPRVMAKDGEKATISINRETFFSVQPANSGLFFQQNLQQIDAGITLDIVPVVRGETVTVNIERAEVSEPIRQQDKTDLNDTRFPLINRRRVATTVHVQDGQTIVIGGLVQRQTIDRFSRIPGLGDIPYLGRLFQYIDQEDAEAEVVIFIAPRIVNPPCMESPAGGTALPAPGPVLSQPLPLPLPQGPGRLRVVPPPPAPQAEESFQPAPAEVQKVPTQRQETRTTDPVENEAAAGAGRASLLSPPTETPAQTVESPSSKPSSSVVTQPPKTMSIPKFNVSQPAPASSKTIEVTPETLPRPALIPQPAESTAPPTTSASESATGTPDAGHTPTGELKFLAPKIVIPDRNAKLSPTK